MCDTCVATREERLTPILDESVEFESEFEPEPEPELEPEPESEPEPEPELLQDTYITLKNEMVKLNDKDILNLIIEHLIILRGPNPGSEMRVHSSEIGGHRGIVSDLKWYERTTHLYRRGTSLKLDKTVNLNLSGEEDDIGIVWTESEGKIKIKSIEKNSPAYYKIQLKPGQILTHIDDITVRMVLLLDLDIDVELDTAAAHKITKYINYKYKRDIHGRPFGPIRGAGVKLTLKEEGYDFRNRDLKETRLYLSGGRWGMIGGGSPKIGITQEIIDNRRGAWSLKWITLRIRDEKLPLPRDDRFISDLRKDGILVHDARLPSWHPESNHLDYEVNKAIKEDHPLNKIIEDINKLFTEYYDDSARGYTMAFEFIQGNPEDEYTLINNIGHFIDHSMEVTSERGSLKPKKRKKSRKKKSRKKKSRKRKKSRKKKSKNTRKRKTKD